MSGISNNNPLNQPQFTNPLEPTGGSPQGNTGVNITQSNTQALKAAVPADVNKAANAANAESSTTPPSIEGSGIDPTKLSQAMMLYVASKENGVTPNPGVEALAKLGISNVQLPPPPTLPITADTIFLPGTLSCNGTTYSFTAGDVWYSGQQVSNEVQNWFQNNPNPSPQDISNAEQQFGITNLQFQKLTMPDGSSSSVATYTFLGWPMSAFSPAN